MDTKHINVKNLPRAVYDRCQTRTPLPHWQKASWTGMPHFPKSNRKLYLTLAGWAVVLGVAVAAGLSQGRRWLTADRTVIDSTGITPNMPPIPEIDVVKHLELLEQPEVNLPSMFRHVGENRINHAEVLLPVARLLATDERPMRLLLIGDSHVAGRTFPNTLKAALSRYLGTANSPETGSGLWMDYVATNGATLHHYHTADDLERFEAFKPDLIVVAMGTNEAHGMGYRETTHEREMSLFFDDLKKVCPEAVVLLTTPPGDYLKRSYVDYRQSTRSNGKTRRVRQVRTPNPMSARCAACIADFAATHDMALWDLFNISGGEEYAQRNWVTGHFMRPDRIHFEPKGYELQGELLAGALASALAELPL